MASSPFLPVACSGMPWCDPEERQLLHFVVDYNRGKEVWDMTKDMLIEYDAHLRKIGGSTHRTIEALYGRLCSLRGQIACRIAVDKYGIDMESRKKLAPRYWTGLQPEPSDSDDLSLLNLLPASPGGQRLMSTSPERSRDESSDGHRQPQGEHETSTDDCWTDESSVDDTSSLDAYWASRGGVEESASSGPKSTRIGKHKRKLNLDTGEESSDQTLLEDAANIKKLAKLSNMTRNEAFAIYYKNIDVYKRIQRDSSEE